MTIKVELQAKGICALKTTASDVLLIELHFLIDKNRMTVHVEICTKHFGLKLY